MVQATSTVRVAQVGLDVTDQGLEDLFSDYGPIKRCFVVKPKKTKINNKDVNRTIGYVEFAIAEDAETAINEISQKSPELGIPGTPITVTSAPDRSSPQEGQDKQNNNNRKNGRKTIEDNLIAAKQKKSRLIVRNIPWKSTDKTLKAHFEAETGGKVVDVNILKKKDGKMVGCAFVQLSNVSEASKAIKLANGKPFLGRPIAVDWAISKDQFKKGNFSTSETINGNDDLESNEDDKQENDIEDKTKLNDPEVDEAREESDASSEDDDATEDEIDEDSDDSSEEKTSNKKDNWPKTGHDINENKTVFIRNISFDSEQDDLKDMIEENFGKVLFARLVIDKVTDHPKGTAFVKFSTEESAEKCIKVSQSKEGLYLDGRQIFAIAALPKEDAEKNQKEKKEKNSKDNRNLYLAREGLVRDGTLASEGVSKEDMAKRNQLARWKKQMLKDLTMFVSPTRLCVRNLPPNIDDKSLKKIMLKFADDPGAKITECKIMRDFKTSDSNTPKSVGTSKGHGFVSYTTHESAINALRKVNNNPMVFKKEQRPIIEFSVENRTALNARQKRLQKSREKNPLWKGNKSETIPQQSSHVRPKAKEEIKDKPKFMGSANNPNQKNLPTHEGPKVRHKQANHKITRRDLKKKEKEKRNPKKRKANVPETNNSTNENKPSSAKRQKVEENTTKKQSKRLSRKQAKKQKNQNENKDIRDEKQFASMVAKYKSKLTNSDGVAVRNKWFN